MVAGAPAPPFSIPFRVCGEGFGKGNFVSLSSGAEVWNPLRRGPGFLLLFSIKSKEEILCFAERVLNWRTTYLHQEKL